MSQIRRLREQQRRQRQSQLQVQRQTDRQLQQRALRTGKSISQIKAEEDQIKAEERQKAFLEQQGLKKPQEKVETKPLTPHEQAVDLLAKKIAGYRIGVGNLPEDVRKEYDKISFKYWNVYGQSMGRVSGLKERFLVWREKRNPYYGSMPTQPSTTISEKFVVTEKAKEMARISQSLGGSVTAEEVQRNINKLSQQIKSGKIIPYSPISSLGTDKVSMIEPPKVCYLRPEDVPKEFRDVIASEDIGGFGRVSAQDLKGELDIGGYGYSDLDRDISGTAGRQYTPISGEKYGISGISGFFGDIFSAFKKEEKETFEGGKYQDPFTGQKFNITTGEGTLVSAYGLGAGGTALFYPLTLEQMEEQEKLTSTEQKIFGVETKSESALLIAESKFKAQRKQAEKVEELKKEINEIYSKLEKEGKIDTTTNTFTEKATQTETSQYNKLYNRLEREEERLGDRQLYVGLGAGLGKKVDVSGVETGISLISQTTGIVGGKVVAKLGKEEGYFTIPEKEADIYIPQFGTQIIDPVTGEPMTGKEKITISKKKIGTPEQFEIVGGLGATLALYSTPYVGTGLFTYEIGKEFKEADYSPIKFVTENPVEAILLGTIGASKIAKLYRRTLGKPIIDTEKLTLGAGKEIQPYGFASRPKIIQVGEKTFIQREVGGISQTIKVGQRTIITTRIRKLLGLDPIYLGNPYIEQSAYQKALNLLIKSGHTEKSARQVLRLRRPKFKENIFKGEALTIYGDDINIILKGRQKTKDILGAKFEDLQLKNIDELRRIYAKGYPIRTKGEVDLFKLWQKETKSFLTKQSREFQKLRQAGKTTEQYAIITGAKKTGETALPLKQFDDILLGKEFEVFKEASLAQKIIPKQRKITDSLSKIFIEKGEPKFKITFDTGITELKGFRIKGKKSSEQYLRQLYRLEGEEKGVAGALSKVIKPKPSRVSKVEVIPETSPQLSKYWGKGMYERTEGGLLPRVKGGLGLKFDKRLGLALGITPKQIMEEKQREKQIQKELLKITPKLSLVIKTTPKFKDILGVSTNLAQESVQKLDTLQRQQLITPSVRGINLITDQLITPKPTKIKKPKILFPFPDETKGKALRKIRQQPYILEIKSKKKWKKVGKVFPSEQRAKDVGAYITDVTLPAQFRVKPTKKKPSEKQFNIPPNYEKLYGFKFRPYKIRKQVKIPLKQRFIERKIFRLDTAGEVNKIHLEKYLAEQRRKTKQKRIRQKNLSKLFFPQFR